MAKRWIVEPGSSVHLDRINPDSTPHAPGNKKATEAKIAGLNKRLLGLQDRLWAERTRSLLVILQGIDASGKDGSIRHVFGGVNPQATRAVSFKAPTDEERAHDFLWRIHRHAPAAGETVIFNRSHYEDVLIVRVHKLVPRAVWSKRYAIIDAFERTLTSGGTTIVKFFLHISKAEQLRRFQERLDDPDKRWKFNRGDIDERKRWDDYHAAYTDVLEKTSTPHAPWHIIPADRKWYRNWAISRVLIEALEELDPQYPQPQDLDGIELR